MKTQSFNDLVYQIFVCVLLAVLAGYVISLLGQHVVTFDTHLVTSWVREAFHTLVVLPLLHLAK